MIMMRKAGIRQHLLIAVLTSWSMLYLVHGFSLAPEVSSKVHGHAHLTYPTPRHAGEDCDDTPAFPLKTTRRDLLGKLTLYVTVLLSSGERTSASVGTLPEFADTNAILQGLTVKVADKSQQDAMIAFLKDSFDFKVLRQRIIGSVIETVRCIS